MHSKSRSISRSFLMLLFMVLPVVGLVVLPVQAEAARKQSKPLPPVSITIAPVNQQLTAKDIKPGDTVAFNVTAVSDLETPEMTIKIELVGGVKLVSGDLSWTGPPAKNQPKTLTVTVQAPEKGVGRIRARVSLPPSDGTRFSSQAQFRLGVEQPQAKPEHEGVVKKDKEGRDVIEYR